MFALSKELTLPKSVELTTDVYKSIHLKLQSKIEPSEFNSYIEQLLNLEQKNNQTTHPDKQTRAIWVHLNQENLNLISKLSVQLEFKVHHALDTNLVMYKWISSRPDQATPYSMFYVSCGAAVIKDDCIFLVQEKGGNRKGKYGLPGGRADYGESLSSCSQRQLFEETGIKAKYGHLLYFREMTNTVFGGVDIYFVCFMKLDENSLQSMKLCDRQLTDGKWVPLKEYGQFAEKNSFGTQFEVAKIISDLHKNGFDFEKRVPNQTMSHKYTSPRDGITREFIEHMLVENDRKQAL